MKNTRVNKRGNNKRIVKLSNKNLIELLVGKFIIMIILGIIATGVLLGTLAIIGHIVGLAEKYLIIRIILYILGLASIFKLASEAE